MQVTRLNDDRLAAENELEAITKEVIGEYLGPGASKEESLRALLTNIQKVRWAKCSGRGRPHDKADRVAFFPSTSGMTVTIVTGDVSVTLLAPRACRRALLQTDSDILAQGTKTKQKSW